MAELHVVCALRNKPAELPGMVTQREQQPARQRTNLAHLFFPDPGCAMRPARSRCSSVAPRVWLISRSRLPKQGGGSAPAIAEGMAISGHPLHRSERAQFRHSAPALSE
jgi:hypothetical protein